MGLTKVTLFFVLSILSTSLAFNTVTPWSKEVVYNWRALVKAGTYFPARYASQFVLHGKVHVQADKNATHVQIKDLTYKMYNGKLDHHHEHEAHSVPVPEEVHQLQNVFKIVYDTHGHVIGIATGQQEKEWSRNIKRAMASILQVDDSVVKEHHNHPHAFITHEHSIYGYSETHYNVHYHHDEEMVVHKDHHMHDSHHLWQNFFTNSRPVHCDAHFEEPFMHSSNKKYVITKHEDHHVVKHIDAVGVIYHYPYKAKSDAQVILSNQTFEMVHVGPIEQQFHMEQEHYDHDLTYHILEEETDEKMLDMTNGRRVINYEKLIPQVKEALHDIHEYLHEDHIHTHEVDTKKGQSVNRVRRMLKFFTLEKLKELHETLSGEVLRIYHHMLPLLGSHASAHFIKHLIVNKAVEEEVAVEMLQHVSEHLVMVGPEFLAEMEELIHLKDDISWNVRRAAILSFASLIHKSHQNEVEAHHRQQHQKEQHHDEESGEAHHGQHHDEDSGHHAHVEHTENHDLEQHYKKYIDEYINKIKNSKEYKVQMTYILGLYNMKLHSLIKHIIPAFNGEWWHDRHLRFISMLASSSVIEDEDTVFEAFWPIFTNHQEHTELRITAYYYLMQPPVSPSRLRNIFSFMLTEPNQELYHYHYTYVRSMMHSKEPCLQDYRVQMAQMMKLMHPPSHGQSSVHVYDYEDVTFEFSGGVQNHFIHTNVSHIYGMGTYFQRANVLNEDYFFILKIHGLQQPHTTVSHVVMDFFRKQIPKITNNEDIHVELIVFRKNRVIASYFLDQHNLHELNHMLDFFTKESHSVTKDLLHISYDRFHKVLIPTDLGTPALLEIIMPNVHHHNITVKKEVTNKIINLHIHNRYFNSIHHRYGLSFYNPIADVWQGINSYHAYDAVLPIHLDIAINLQQQSVQISWHKHADHLMDVSGLRSHSKQMTFVKDDFHSNVLVQSSPTSKNWQVVSNGKEYRQDYTLMDEDDLNTGHKWHVGMYDCGHHITNGSFQHRMYLFAQSFTKNVDSPMSHLWMSYLNFHQYAVLTPRDGICGFIVRVEPSHEHLVSNIDLSLRVHQELTEKDSYHYTPGNKISTRLTYAVKNKEQSLKTWDVNAILDMNPGHTVNNLKMYITRIIPGQKDYKICVDRVKKWTQKGVSSHLNIAMSQSPDGKCVKDDTVIDVTMTGKRSHEQETEHHLYGSCSYPIPYVVPDYLTLNCLGSHTSVRHYVYNVKTTNVPTEFKKFFGRLWDRVKGQYISYYTYEDEHNEDIGEHHFKVDMVYPMEGHEVDIHLTTPQHVHSLTGVPTDHWKQFGFRPDSLAYSYAFYTAHQEGDVDHCIVHHDHHHLNHHHQVHEVVPNDWTLYVGDTEENPHEAVYVKHVGDDQIAVKVVCHDHNFEIVPHGEGHQITADGKAIPLEEHHHLEDWVTFLTFHDIANQPVAAIVERSGLHLEYDGHHVVVIVPQLKDEHHWHGHCYTQH